jgi:hypothetical protein
MEKHFVGQVKYLNSLVFFSFDNWILTLYPDQKLAESIVFTQISPGVMGLIGKSLASDTIEGKSFENEANVYFRINPNNYKINNPFFVTSIAIPVYAYFIKTKERSPKQASELIFKSKQMFRFLSLIPNNSFTSSSGTTGASIKYDTRACSKKSSFSINAHSFSIFPYWHSHLDANFDFTPGLVFNFPNGMEVDKIFSYSETMISLIQFLFYRTDIFPDEIEYISETERGEVFILHNEIQAANELIGSCWTDSILWENIYPYIGNLFIEIFNKKVFLEHIPEDLNGRLGISYKTVYFDSSAFENAFSEIGYDKKIEKEKSNKKETKEIQKILDNQIKLTSRGTKKAFKFYKKLSSKETLENKIKYAFSTFKVQLEWIKGKVASNLDYSKIATKCADCRNKTDHGDSNKIINKEIAGCFILLRAVIYCLQLKRASADDDTITKAIHNIFGVEQIG